MDSVSRKSFSSNVSSLFRSSTSFILTQEGRTRFVPPLFCSAVALRRRYEVLGGGSGSFFLWGVFGGTWRKLFLCEFQPGVFVSLDKVPAQRFGNVL